jgi:hypothetical protein
MSLTKRAGSGDGSVGQRYGSEDPDPHQNVTDPEQWLVPLRIKWRRKATEGIGRNSVAWHVTAR